jgi:hypothetical protein
MRWPEEVETNVRIVERYEPPFDVADLPRSTRGIYDAMDEERA